MILKKLYMIIGIMLLILALSGSAYAYFSATASATISGTVAGGADLDLKVVKMSTGANDSLIPLDNTTDMLTKAVIGYNNDSKEDSKRCIDKNGYVACQIYKITITNNSSISVVLNGGVSLYGDFTPNIECAIMDDINTVTSNKSCRGNKTLAKKMTLNGNESKDYYIIVYIKNIEEVQTDTGDFSGTVFFNVNGERIETTFEDSPAYNTLINLGLSVDKEHTPDFNTVSGNNGVESDTDGNTLNTGLGDGTNGIYEAEDDLGTSYYFRGNVQNNIVYFAKQFWQIVRINGDGTIRMIFLDTDNGSLPNGTGKSSYNENYKDNAYVGYMYGTVGASTYAETHANTNNSTIKEVIDAWYEENLSDYSEYIADAIYCNDRQVVTNLVFNLLEQSRTFNGNGAGTNETAYASVQRNHLGNVNPTLKCTQKNDRFTVNNDIGNGDLTYPIGLITEDEVIMAGSGVYNNSNDTGISNEDYYLYCDPNINCYRTMTPFVYYNNGFRALVSINSGTFVFGDWGGVQGSVGVRPVISLKADAISGWYEDEEMRVFYVDEVYGY